MRSSRRESSTSAQQQQQQQKQQQQKQRQQQQQQRVSSDSHLTNMAETATPQRTTQNPEVNCRIENTSKFLYININFSNKKQQLNYRPLKSSEISFLNTQ